MEFPGDDGRFEIDQYADGHNFSVNGTPIVAANNGASEWRTPNPQSAPAATTSTPLSSRGLRRTPLASLKIIRADLNSNGKPSNMSYHNLIAHINIYSEEDACISFIERKVREEMACENLKVVGAGGLVILDQEGTRG